MGSLYLGGPTIQEVDGKMMMGLSIYGVAVISGSLYSQFYSIYIRRILHSSTISVGLAQARPNYNTIQLYASYHGAALVSFGGVTRRTKPLFYSLCCEIDTEPVIGRGIVIYIMLCSSHCYLPKKPRLTSIAHHHVFKLDCSAGTTSPLLFLFLH